MKNVHFILWKKTKRTFWLTQYKRCYTTQHVFFPLLLRIHIPEVSISICLLLRSQRNPRTDKFRGHQCGATALTDHSPLVRGRSVCMCSFSDVQRGLLQILVMVKRR